jgi:hypothetical protein
LSAEHNKYQVYPFVFEGKPEFHFIAAGRIADAGIAIRFLRRQFTDIARITEMIDHLI